MPIVDVFNASLIPFEVVDGQEAPADVPTPSDDLNKFSTSRLWLLLRLQISLLVNAAAKYPSPTTTTT
ncbi:hypothetical protein PCASD_04458 [Puccinia coronata f. sp. avenae]|uniref:Uncharacterized protein n=1 Tax=Puccinia coronata f. sp. avenae TaxID=200324 RepID=A0A2N5V371_9BASI|nr:hypothetical protein PCASD_04458 [Puccinia coronata f. sp. avenae]